MKRPNLNALLEGFADVTESTRVTGLSLDSRGIEKGNLFLAVSGATSHGLEYLPQALDAGAAAIAYEPTTAVPDCPVPAIAVPDLRAKAGLIADRFFDAPSAALRVVGITGTNGKTSCAHLLAQALNGAGQKAGVIGTLGAGLVDRIETGERTTPDAVTVQRELRHLLDGGAQAVAMEVSSHALVQHRVNGVRFELAVFTNISRDHLDYHGDMAAYQKAKARLFHWPGLQAAVINADDAYGRELLHTLPASLQKLSCGLADESADVHARGAVLKPGGVQFMLHTPQGQAWVRSVLLGRFNIRNLLAVAACLHVFGWDANTIAARLGALQPVPGRMERLPVRGDQPEVVIDYAHTPDALRQALEALRAHTARRLLVVFGAGGERDTGKRPEMGAVAESLADTVILTDDNPRGEDAGRIIEHIRAGFKAPHAVRVIQPRGAAVAAAIQDAGAGDVVLLAGKGHESYNEAGGRRLPYSERDNAVQALAGGTP